MIYSKDLIGKKESVVDEVLLLDPMQIPLLSLLGFGAPVKNTKHEWNEDEMFATESTATNSAGTGTTLQVTSAEPFRDDQVIQFNDELILITAGGGTTTLTVTRGYAGTTPESISIGDTVTVMYNQGTEGATARAARDKARVNNYNYTQIFDDTIDISGSTAEVDQYGIKMMYEYEKQKKLAELALSLEQALINGVDHVNGNVRTMAGLRHVVTTNVTDASSADISLDILQDSLQDIWERGGMKGDADHRILVPATQKRRISQLFDDQLLVSQMETKRGTRVNGVVTDFGDIPVMLMKNLKSNEAMIVDVNRLSVRPLGSRSFFHKYLGEVGDNEHGMLIGEYTFECKQEKAHARIKNLKNT